MDFNVAIAVQNWVKDMPYCDNEEEQINMFYKVFETQSATLWDCFKLDDRYYLQMKFRNLRREFLVELSYEPIKLNSNDKGWVVKKVTERLG